MHVHVVHVHVYVHMHMYMWLHLLWFYLRPGPLTLYYGFTYLLHQYCITTLAGPVKTMTESGGQFSTDPLLKDKRWPALLRSYEKMWGLQYKFFFAKLGVKEVLVI